MIESKCSECESNLMKHKYYTEVPKLMVFEYPNQKIATSHKITFKSNGDTTVLHLRGIVYHGSNHFTSRIISSEGDIWFHDGIATGKSCEDDGHLSTTSNQDLKSCKGRQLVLAIYAEK